MLTHAMDVVDLSGTHNRVTEVTGHPPAMQLATVAGITKYYHKERGDEPGTVLLRGFSNIGRGALVTLEDTSRLDPLIATSVPSAETVQVVGAAAASEIESMTNTSRQVLKCKRMASVARREDEHAASKATRGGALHVEFI
jgi:hypothetical protein